MNHREGLVGFRFLSSSGLRLSQGGRYGNCNISRAPKWRGQSRSPLSRQDEHSCCTEEEIETPETRMSLGLEQRLDCDVDI
jgi:hypothetical protein